MRGKARGNVRGNPCTPAAPFTRGNCAISRGNVLLRGKNIIASPIRFVVLICFASTRKFGLDLRNTNCPAKSHVCDETCQVLKT